MFLFSYIARGSVINSDSWIIMTALFLFLWCLLSLSYFKWNDVLTSQMPTFQSASAASCACRYQPLVFLIWLSVLNTNPFQQFIWRQPVTSEWQRMPSSNRYLVKVVDEADPWYNAKSLTDLRTFVFWNKARDKDIDPIQNMMWQVLYKHFIWS